jgi:hypothetical protein
MKFNVGEIIYIIDPKGKGIVPVRINEQLVSRTVQGETITHNVDLPSGQTTNLENLNATCFSTLDEVRDYLLARAKEVIEGGINSAKETVSKVFKKVNEIQPPENTNMKLQNDMEVTLEDGRKATVSIPHGFLDENTDN